MYTTNEIIFVFVDVPSFTQERNNVKWRMVYSMFFLGLKMCVPSFLYMH